MFHLLAGVLAIGNVRFEDHGDGKRATVVQTPDDALARAAACLGVDATALEAALTSVTLVVGGSDTKHGVAMKRASSWIGAESSVRDGRVSSIGEGGNAAAVSLPSAHHALLFWRLVWRLGGRRKMGRSCLLPRFTREGLTYARTNGLFVGAFAAPGGGISTNPHSLRLPTTNVLTSIRGCID